jgi:hypothetical protein
LKKLQGTLLKAKLQLQQHNLTITIAIINLGSAATATFPSYSNTDTVLHFWGLAWRIALSARSESRALQATPSLYWRHGSSALAKLVLLERYALIK